MSQTDIFKQRDCSSHACASWEMTRPHASSGASEARCEEAPDSRLLPIAPPSPTIVQPPPPHFTPPSSLPSVSGPRLRQLRRGLAPPTPLSLRRVSLRPGVQCWKQCVSRAEPGPGPVLAALRAQSPPPLTPWCRWPRDQHCEFRALSQVRNPHGTRLQDTSKGLDCGDHRLSRGWAVPRCWLRTAAPRPPAPGTFTSLQRSATKFDLRPSSLRALRVHSRLSPCDQLGSGLSGLRA